MYVNTSSYILIKLTGSVTVDTNVETVFENTVKKQLDTLLTSIILDTQEDTTIVLAWDGDNYAPNLLALSIMYVYGWLVKKRKRSVFVSLATFRDVEQQGLYWPPYITSMTDHLAVDDDVNKQSRFVHLRYKFLNPTIPTRDQHKMHRKHSTWHNYHLQFGGPWRGCTFQKDFMNKNGFIGAQHVLRHTLASKRYVICIQTEDYPAKSWQTEREVLQGCKVNDNIYTYDFYKAIGTPKWTNLSNLVTLDDEWMRLVTQANVIRSVEMGDDQAEVEDID